MTAQSSKKRDKVLGRGRGGGRGRRRVWFIAGAALVLMAVVALKLDPLGLGGADLTADGGSGGPLYKLSSRTYDQGTRLQQAPVEPEHRDGRVYLPLATIEGAGIVRFELPDHTITLPNGSTFDVLPVTVYVAPSGKVVAAVSFCEPCSGTTFHIRGDRLVCNACGTQWKLESLKGVIGGCMDYPPDPVAYTVEGDQLILDEAELRAWTPRD